MPSSRDNTESINLGMEYGFGDAFSAGRLPRLFLRDREQGLPWGGLATRNLGNALIQLDYAIRFRRLENAQRFSFNWPSEEGHA